MSTAGRVGTDMARPKLRHYSEIVIVPRLELRSEIHLPILSLGDNLAVRRIHVKLGRPGRTRAQCIQV
jgi:hypothetical protein